MSYCSWNGDCLLKSAMRYFIGMGQFFHTPGWGGAAASPMLLGPMETCYMWTGTHVIEKGELVGVLV